MENRKQVKYLTYLYHKMYGSFLAKKTWNPPPLCYMKVWQLDSDAEILANKLSNLYLTVLLFSKCHFYIFSVQIGILKYELQQQRERSLVLLEEKVINLVNRYNNVVSRPVTGSFLCWRRVHKPG